MGVGQKDVGQKPCSLRVARCATVLVGCGGILKARPQVHRDAQFASCSLHVFTCWPSFVLQNERRCECKRGYVGDGIQCLEEAVPPTDRCLDNNGQCHREAICTDLHFHGERAVI